MSMLKLSRIIEIMRSGALAGIVGGMAEIGWIVFYGAVTGAPMGTVARGIVASVFPWLATSPWAAWLGIGIHLVIAIGLGLSLATATRLLVRRDDAGGFEFGLVMLALAAIWGMNFLVVLPHVNPRFIHLLPFGVTLFSKLLFGFSAAMALRIDRMRRVRIRNR